MIIAVVALTFSVEAGTVTERAVRDAVGRATAQDCGVYVLDTMQPMRKSAPQHLLFSSGFGKQVCKDTSNLAYTQQYAAQIFICPQFNRARKEVQQIVLIHEILHTQGLAEATFFDLTAGPTSQTISRTIERVCRIDAKGAFK